MCIVIYTVEIFEHSYFEIRREILIIVMKYVTELSSPESPAALILCLLSFVKIRIFKFRFFEDIF